MENIWCLLKISGSDEAADTALFKIICLDIKQQEKGSVSNTSRFKYMKERWFQKEDKNSGGKNKILT